MKKAYNNSTPGRTAPGVDLFSKRSNIFATGFTIIEVLIVLAIAGLIMLIVFLAVPALQRNSRNNARNNDASRVSSAVGECLSNRNNSVPSCIDDGDDDDDSNDIQPGNLTELVEIEFGITAFGSTPAYETDSSFVLYQSECDDAGENAEPSASLPLARFSVTYQLEDGVNRCISN